MLHPDWSIMGHNKNTTLKIACYNARGIMASSVYISEFLQKNDIDILAISEHWLFPQSLRYLDSIDNDYMGWGVCCKNADPILNHHRGKGGVAFLFKKSLRHVIQYVDIDHDRIQGVSIHTNDTPLLLFNVYMPSSNHSNVIYDECIEELYDIINASSDKGDCIVMGDFNCDIPGAKCINPTPIRSRTLCKLISDLNFVCIDNSSSCCGRNYTFDPVEDHSVTAHIDHILVHIDIVSRIKYCAIVDEAQNPSDHLPIISHIQLVQDFNEEANYETFVRKKLKWDKFTSEEIKEKYTKSLSEKLKDIQMLSPSEANAEDVSIYYKNLVQCMLLVSQTVIPAVKYHKSLKPFWNDDVRNAYRNMRALRLDWLRNGKPRAESLSFTRYKAAKHTFQRVFRQAKFKWECEENENIEKSAEVDHKKFWSLVNLKRKAPHTKHYAMKFDGKECANTSDILKGWESYFTQLYSPLEDKEFDKRFKKSVESKFDKYKQDNVNVLSDLDYDISAEEVRNSCMLLKLNSAGGFDMLTNEHLRYGGSDLYNHLSCLFTCMLQLCTTPNDMKKGIIVTILKPGKKVKTDPDNYRGITLLPVVYKLYEKVTLNRIMVYLSKLNPVIPDPLQAAYQKQLSSLNTSFCLLEAVNYNVERGSKVFVCCLDAVKAFDTVWHCGLFTRLYECGIKGLLWYSIIESYTDMCNCVLYNDRLSDPIPVLQSTRQGSFWGGWFFLVFIDPLITHLRKLGLGAHVMDLFVGILLQADDIALISVNKHTLDIMIKECFLFACKWRIRFHPRKSKILVYGDKIQCKRNWIVEKTVIDEVKCHTHCGVILCTEKSRISHTKDICRKGRGIMLSLLNSGLGNLNPISLCKLYKSVVLPSMLFSCELWYNISRTEELMIERCQRFCAKCIQHLSRRARSDICCPMLGLLPLCSYIDGMKLNFFRRLMALPNTSISKQLFLRRWYQYKLEFNTTVQFCSEIYSLLTKYGLRQYVETYFFEDLYIPPKIIWKKMCKSAIFNYECNSFEQRTSSPEFELFKSIHLDISDYSYLWHLAKKYPHKLYQCYAVGKYLAEPMNQDEELCEFCGRIFVNKLDHRLTACENYTEMRENFWSCIVNTFPCQFSVFLFNLENADLIKTLLGAPLNAITLNEEDYVKFLLVSLDFVYNCLSLT